MFAKFDDIPSMALQDIKERKHYGQMDAHKQGQLENSIPCTQFVEGIIKVTV